MSELRLILRVIGPRGSISLPLHEPGSVTIGRGRDCDVHVDDPLVSRRHALIHGGEVPAFEDLGSGNGSWRRRGASIEQLPPSQRIILVSGDMITFGSGIMVAHSAGPAFDHVMAETDAFETAVGEACHRAEKGGADVAVIRVQLTPSIDPDLAQAALHVIAGVADDVTGCALDMYDMLLLSSSTPAAADTQSRRLAAQLTALALDGDLGLATYPADGVTASALLAAANGSVETVRAAHPTASFGPATVVSPPATPRDEHGVSSRRRLLVGKRGRALVLPSGERVDLARHASLRLLVLAMARRHRDGREGGLSSDDLLACGWPGERVDPFAGNARVRVALSRLRSLGLRDLLLRADDGYVLAPDLTVEIEGEPAEPEPSDATVDAGRGDAE